MTLSREEVREALAREKIYGPGSEELATHERHLTQYFEREYRRLLENPVTLESLGISTSEGPMMEETQALMESHYDQPAEFFKSFLDSKYMAYSMAYYGETPDEIMNSKATLEEAQEAKFALIAKRVGIKGNERILNIGCGFGSLETYLIERFPDVEIHSVTPSKIQINYLNELLNKIEKSSNRNNIRLIMRDFDQLTYEEIGNNKFDIVISIGLLEHSLNMKSFMSRINDILNTGGKTFHHLITSKQAVPLLLEPENTRIGKYFPGGRVWPCKELIKHANNFNIENIWYINGFNYWRTINEWHRRYWDNVLDLYDPGTDKKIIDHWNRYFTLCKIVFSPMNGGFSGNSQYLFKKPG